MASYAGSKISTNGLVLCVDFASTKCYNGSGSTVINLVSKINQFNGTLQNTPTFTSIGGGSFLFDNTFSEDIYFQGLDDEIDYLFADSASRWSYSVWFRPTANTQGIICGLAGGIGGSTTNALYMDSSNNVILRLRGTNSDTTIKSSLNTSRFHFVCATWNGSTCLGYYNNESPIGVNVGTAAVQDELDFHLASCRQNLGNYPYFDGYIAHCTVYNRTISRNEINEIYYSTRRRFE